MKRSGLDGALEAIFYMEKGQPYSLHPDDKKRALLRELEPLCRELGVSPVVIGGLAVSHHGYVRTTRDVDFLLTERDALTLGGRLKAELGWKRQGEGFKNTILDVGLDICVEGRRTSPRGTETFPSPESLRSLKVEPFRVVALPELLALKVKSARAQDDADVVGLLKAHARRMVALAAQASSRLSTPAARAHLKGLVQRAREELRR